MSKKEEVVRLLDKEIEKTQLEIEAETNKDKLAIKTEYLSKLIDKKLQLSKDSGEKKFKYFDIGIKLLSAVCSTAVGVLSLGLINNIEKDGTTHYTWTRKGLDSMTSRIWKR